MYTAATTGITVSMTMAVGDRRKSRWRKDLRQRAGVISERMMLRAVTSNPAPLDRRQIASENREFCVFLWN